MTFGERFRKVRKRMRADADKGSAAIEFAMVAPVFFVLLLGIFEAAIMFFSQAVLQNAMTDMGRYVRTGQAACHTKDAAGACTAAMTQAQFRTEVCNKVAPLIPCNGNLQIDVKKAAGGFGGATYTSPLTSAGALNTAMNGYDIGAACDVVLARAFYTWPVATPVLSWFLVNMAGDKHLMTAATAFRNEPFVNGVAGC